MKMLLTGAAIAAIAATAVLAQVPQGRPGMMGPMTRSEVEAKVKAHFAEVDANKDGAITKDEAEGFHAKHRAEMRDKMFAMMDANKDGQISREEFNAQPPHGQMGGMGAMSGDQPGGPPMRGKHGMHGGMHGRGMMGHGNMFARADANNDGKVTLQEATSKALEKFDRADTNHDGTVTPEERRAAMKSWMEQHRPKAG